MSLGLSIKSLALTQVKKIDMNNKSKAFLLRLECLFKVVFLLIDFHEEVLLFRVFELPKAILQVVYLDGLY